MRQFLLAAALILGAVGVFWGGRTFVFPAAPALTTATLGASLGDLQPMEAIVADVATIVGTGDLTKAETRITDLETAWDEAEATMRPKNPEAWGRVDDAIDAALSALRASTPDAATAADALAKLQVVMADPTGPATGGGVEMVGAVAVTDAGGHPLPCEQLIGQVKEAIAGGTVKPEADDLLTKALERCNADDDRNANQFSAQALGLTKG